MKIATLLAREPFARIFEATLSRWLSARFGGQYGVQWRRAERLAALPWRSDPHVWLVNPHLNLIVRSDAPASVFRQPREEFRRAIGVARRVPQALYAEVAGRRASAWALAPFQVGIDPVPPASRGWLIMGGTLRLRIVDVGARRSWVIPKLGVDPRFHRADVHARRVLAAPLAPPLVEVPEPPEWYAEALAPGLPQNRLGSADARRAAFEVAASALDTWTSARARPVALAETVEGVLSTVARAALPPALTAGVAGAMDAIRRAAERDRPSIERGPTHGDFQPANVLCGASGTWLIDWERSGDRCLHYDALVWHTGARQTPRWPDALDGWTRGGEEWRRWARMRPKHSGMSEAERAAVAVAFLADELWYRVEEAEAAPQADHAPAIAAVRSAASRLAR